MINFGEWLPDQSSLGASTTVATNVIPAFKGYRPFKNLSALSSATSSPLRGLFPTKQADGTVNLFAGSGTQLLKYNNSDTSLSNVSKAGDYSVNATSQWQFIQFGDDVLATEIATPIQKFTLGSSSNFADVTSAPSAKFMKVVKDFVVTAHVNYGSVLYPRRVRWSQINDASSWTIGSNQADIQDLADSGFITGLVGGEEGVVLTEKGIFRMQYVGSPLIFTFQKISNVGCTFPHSVSSLSSDKVFYANQDGFFLFNGKDVLPIGSEKVDIFFSDDLNSNFTNRISCSIDPVNQIVCWSYPSTQSTSGVPDKILIYNYAIARWSLVEISHDFIGEIATPPQTLESLDNLNSSIDALGISLDSPAFAGGLFLFGASKDNKIQSFSGDNLSAVLETTEFEPVKQKRSLIKTVTPIVDRGSSEPIITVQVGSRSRQSDNVVFTSASSLTSDNFCNTRSNGRYHRIRVNASGTWKFAFGVDIEASSLGKR
tara:strand:- start:2165 stop:3622 length:1458 start_codon:yes stop_codon:yes gene_type:complete